MTKDMIGDSMPAGQTSRRSSARSATPIDSGVDHVYLHQIGDDQEGFCKVWSAEIAPALAG